MVPPLDGACPGGLNRRVACPLQIRETCRLRERARRATEVAGRHAMPVAAAAPDTPRSVLRPGALHRVEAKLAAARSSPEARNELASRIKDWERQRRATLYAHHNFLVENRAELPGRTWDTVHKRRSMLYATECRKVDAAQERRLKLLEEAELRRVEKGRRDAQRHAEVPGHQSSPYSTTDPTDRLSAMYAQAEARLPPRPLSQGQRRPATAGPSSTYLLRP